MTGSPAQTTKKVFDVSSVNQGDSSVSFGELKEQEQVNQPLISNYN